MSKPLQSWYDALQGTTAIGFDIETSGTDPRSSRIYNMGVSIFGPKEKHTNYFMKDLVDPNNLESSFLDIHEGINSKLFAQGQIDRGILNEYEQAIKNKQLVSVNTAFNKLTSAVERTKGPTYILGQNMQFENTMFKSAINFGEITNKSIARYNRVTGRTSEKLANKHLFAEYESIANLKELGSDLSVRERLKEIKNQVRQGNLASANQHLVKYSDHYTDIMNKYKSMLHSNKTPVVDLMDVTRALYAQGALRGDMNIAYIDRGANIDFLSNALFSQPEKHLGAEDNIVTKKIFDIFTNELDKYDADPNYRSSLLQDLDSKIKSTSEIEKSFVKNFKSHLQENQSQSSDISTLKKKLADSFLSYSHIDHKKSVRDSIYNKTIDMLDNNTDNIDKVIQYLDSVSFAENVNKPSSLSSTMSLMKNKKVLLGSAVVLGASMLSSDTDKKTNYNTYDELYNNQYYGTEFADWQERNNSHKLMY